MNIKEIINKKQKNLILTEKEISFFIKGYIKNLVSDKDMTLLLKAIYVNGMNAKEIIYYTKELIASGKVLPTKENWVDKHSSGGVGDKTSLILLPILAAMELKIMKISGRSLGFTGGTVDKLESIGFNTSLSINEAIMQTEQYGLSLTGQTENLVPADKKIYELRDITGTSSSLPLIAASIMSKKIASGAKNILIDLKIGSGAFIKNLTDGKKLGNMIKKLGKAFDRNVFILFSSMKTPLGIYVGNANEIMEVYDFLLGYRRDLRTYKLLKKIATELHSKSKNISITKSEKIFEEVLDSKKAFFKFTEWMKLQNVDTKIFKDKSYFCPKFKTIVKSSEEGFLSYDNVSNIGKLLQDLGVGRKTKIDKISFSSGIKLNFQPSDYVNKYQDLFTVYSEEELDESFLEKMKQEFIFSKNKKNSNVILGEISW